ncbi:hypothetical protein [Pyxidicoccus xibeiensis]|uniref:hypothetical protein n=1 Tax=Pyxidicoccus xibeiensis TaxID=2906759 RepID=UPI0020A785F1|nr:hypothetical protein [Pyxidicoccus xibeiensis]MCP3137746.1 hypothetical protein [Pyxidicoccus xibeiensis]
MKISPLVVLALCLACTPTPGADADGPDAKLARFIREPETVRIFSARPVPVPPGQDAGTQPVKWTRAGSFGFTHEGPVLTEAERQALAKSWVPPQDVKKDKRGRLMCSFSHDIALRFQRGDTWVDAVVCFTCGEVLFFNEKREGLDGGTFKFPLLGQLTDQAFPGEKFGNARDDW